MRLYLDSMHLWRILLKITFEIFVYIFKNQRVEEKIMLKTAHTCDPPSCEAT